MLVGWLSTLVVLFLRKGGLPEPLTKLFLPLSDQSLSVIY